MPKTRAELVAKALSILQQEGSGQPQAPEDTAKVDECVVALTSELDANGVLTIGNLDEIDDAVFLPLARMLANETGDDFGRPYSEEYRLAQEMRIRKVTATGPLYVTLATDYF